MQRRYQCINVVHTHTQLAVKRKLRHKSITHSPMNAKIKNKKKTNDCVRYNFSLL